MTLNVFTNLLDFWQILGGSYMDNQMVPTNSSSEVETVPKLQVIYRCKKCRRIVAAEENVISHEPGKGEECFVWRKRTGNPKDWGKGPVECSSIFVEPLKWMQAVEEGYLEEKLLCICKARLGSFNWAGMQCNCGAWINPAFQLHKSRIDECHM
ncbi:hypothetical protein SAY86_011640 [Trapa natans]|uniref:Dual specificity protein phosphatase 12 n=1 Tax=Trapa natans TaxID=22666 RepID=A0AAN7LXC8_TRANT|nr:hypothetical protein SAY86_011640 [Trapa natans]